MTQPGVMEIPLDFDKFPRNNAERLFRKTLDPSSRIYDYAHLTRSVQEVHMGKNSFIGDFCFISVPQLFLEEGAQINAHSNITGRKPVVIGKFSTVSYGCTLITSSDSTEARNMNDAVPVSQRILREGPIGIGDKCFIGAHSIIMPGVNVSQGNVVRAFSYVNKPLTIPHSIYGGQPCLLLKERGYVRSTDT
jgi:acetyltransferase-like isoleucine patch superfamily enzyme